jgi:hypothetical protein
MAATPLTAGLPKAVTNAIPHGRVPQTVRGPRSVKEDSTSGTEQNKLSIGLMHGWHGDVLRKKTSVDWLDLCR